MFDDIGGKIKGLAMFICWLGIIASILIGMFFLANTNEDDEGAVIGLCIMLIGPFISWVSSFFMYGLGQLIQNTDVLVEQHKKIQGDIETCKNEAVENNDAVVAAENAEEVDINNIRYGLCEICKKEFILTKNSTAEGESEIGKNHICPDCADKAEFQKTITKEE